MQVQKINNYETNFKARFSNNSLLKQYKSALTKPQLEEFQKQEKLLSTINDNRIFYLVVDKAKNIAKLVEKDNILSKVKELPMFVRPLTEVKKLFEDMETYYKFTLIGR